MNGRFETHSQKYERLLREHIIVKNENAELEKEFNDIRENILRLKSDYSFLFKVIYTLRLRKQRDEETRI